MHICLGTYLVASVREPRKYLSHTSHLFVNLEDDSFCFEYNILDFVVASSLDGTVWVPSVLGQCEGGAFAILTLMCNVTDSYMDGVCECWR